jgi:hypothetical protein
MSYSLKFYDTEGMSESTHREVEKRFRHALEAALGDAALVAPVYRAYLRIVAAYGETPDPDSLGDAERVLFEQWQAAETVAVAAAFGPNRTMGDAMYEIRIDA